MSSSWLTLLSLYLSSFSSLSSASPLVKKDTSVKLDGYTFVNQGLVAFGLIPSNAIESTGDTLGGLGSALAIKPGSWVQNGEKYEGTFVMHPDRGYNVEETINYQARSHEFSFTLTPYTSSKSLSFAEAKKTLVVTYKSTTLQYDAGGATTTGLDALGVRDGSPVVPVASSTDKRLSLDVEGIVVLPDGSSWISDEYGPYIYKYSSSGELLQVIQPPAAVLPYNKDGEISFTSDEEPETGRGANAGFEGLTYDASTQTLYALLQNALIQDGGAEKETARYTRLFAFSFDGKLTGEWVVPLPVSNDKGKTRGCSEIAFVGNDIFLALSRDGDGRGGDDTKSKYKQADLFSIAKATNIAGTKYDDPSKSIKKDGKLDGDLDSGITPAKYVSFVDYIDDDELERFGLHNDGDDDGTLIDAKWESLALAPVGDEDSPDDYFLFTAADNDFISTQGIALGVPFDAGIDVDNQFFVFRVTLPAVDKEGLKKSLGL